MRTRFVAIALGFALAVMPGTATAAPGDPDPDPYPTEQRHIPAPMLLEECPSIPSEADDDMLVLIKHVLDGEDVTDKVRLATYETAWVESHVNDLDCGDRDSVGLYQQRPSQGWANAGDPELSTYDFLHGNPGGGAGAIEVDQDNPEWTAGQIAQEVQVSDFPDRYDEAQEKAEELIQRAADLDEGCEDDPDGCDDPPDENDPPVVDAGPDVSGTEGDPIELAGSVTDPDGDAVSTLWTITPAADVDPGAECTLSTDDAAATLTCTDDGTFEATLTAADAEHNGVTDSATVTVENAAPSAEVTEPEPGTLVEAAQPVPVAVAFTDPGANDTHECLVDFGDGSAPVAGEVSQSAGECVAEHSYGVEGVGPRTVTATVKDDDGGEAQASTDVVVYVPGAGHVVEATGAVEIEPTPAVSCPPDAHESSPSISTPVVELDALSVDCTVDTATGRTDVVSAVAEARLLTGLVTIEGIESSCTASADGVARSSHVGSINGIAIGSEPGTVSLLGGLVAVHHNESTTDEDGHLVQNALRVVVAGQQVTVASCRLG